MPAPHLSDALLDHGREFARRLEELGLHANAVLWVYDHLVERFTLTIVWSGIDRYGPLEITEWIFRAHNAALLPAEIDPFGVAIVNPRHGLGHDIMKALTHGGDAFRSRDTRGQVVHFWQQNWVYRSQRDDKSRNGIARDWTRFKAEITRLAA